MRNLSWPAQDFRRAELGDLRRTQRFCRLLEAVSANAGHTIAGTFTASSERQAAYDFLEHDAVDARLVVRAAAEATARKAACCDEVFLVVDGSSLTCVDGSHTKDFGSIGKKSLGCRGIKCMTSLLLSPDGVTLGVGEIIWWNRPLEVTAVEAGRRPLNERESYNWHKSVDVNLAHLRSFAPKTSVHVISDRESDTGAFMENLVAADVDFTIRGNHKSRQMLLDGRRVNLLKRVRRSAPVGSYSLDVPASAGRKARRVSLDVKVARVELVVGGRSSSPRTVELSVVWASEMGRVPSGQKRIDWVLYTTKNLAAAEDVARAIETYTYRWRIEDFHRAWKRGGYDVEKNQLRKTSSVMKWATITAVVAARAERIKHLSRTQPDAPATLEFSLAELKALRHLKELQKKRTEALVEGMPTMDIATRWLADLGGYVGNRGSGLPGAVVIGRGLERLAIGMFVLGLKPRRRKEKR